MNFASVFQIQNIGLYECRRIHNIVYMTIFVPSTSWKNLFMCVCTASLRPPQKSCPNPGALHAEVYTLGVHPLNQLSWVTAKRSPELSITFTANAPPNFDWCCFHDFVRNSLAALLEALCAQISSLDSCISVFCDMPFFRPSQPGSFAWLSPFLLCADSTCVLVGVCLCMCMWKCVGEVINI